MFHPEMAPGATLWIKFWHRALLLKCSEAKLTPVDCAGVVAAIAIVVVALAAGALLTAAEEAGVVEALAAETAGVVAELLAVLVALDALATLLVVALLAAESAALELLLGAALVICGAADATPCPSSACATAPVAVSMVSAVIPANIHFRPLLYIL